VADGRVIGESSGWECASAGTFSPTFRRCRDRDLSKELPFLGAAVISAEDPIAKENVPERPVHFCGATDGGVFPWSCRWGQVQMVRIDFSTPRCK
jgi:hypothetical protein